MTDEPTHHHAAELNLRKIIEDITQLGDASVPTAVAQAVFAERTATATLANTQALLAINETLMAILDRMPPRETP